MRWWPECPDNNIGNPSGCVEEGDSLPSVSNDCWNIAGDMISENV